MQKELLKYLWNYCQDHCQACEVLRDLDPGWERGRKGVGEWKGEGGVGYILCW